MVNAGLIVIAFVCAGFAGWNVARSRHYKKKWKDLNGNYGKLKQDLTNALGEVGRVKSCNEDALSEIKLLNKAIKDRDAVLYFGRNNLTWMEQLPSQSSGSVEGSIMVIGQNKESGFFFIVKVFRFYINDHSDREFAIREAEELIETIQKF